MYVFMFEASGPCVYNLLVVVQGAIDMVCTYVFATVGAISTLDY